MERTGKADDGRSLGLTYILTALFIGSDHSQGNPGFPGQLLLGKSVQLSPLPDGDGPGVVPGVKDLEDLGDIGLMERIV